MDLVPGGDGMRKYAGISFKYRLQWFWERHMEKLPWVRNEGQATAKLIDYQLNGYPMTEDHTLESAMDKLQTIWSILDDWGDGRRINVLRAERSGYYIRGRRKRPVRPRKRE